MSDDIVTRLRKKLVMEALGDKATYLTLGDCLDAADEIERLEGELDKVRRRLEELQDVTRAAQRLYDEIHLAGKTHVKIAGSVTDQNIRTPGGETFTIQGHGAGLHTAVANLGDALRTLYTA